MSAWDTAAVALIALSLASTMVKMNWECYACGRRDRRWLLPGLATLAYHRLTCRGDHDSHSQERDG